MGEAAGSKIWAVHHPIKMFRLLGNNFIHKVLIEVSHFVVIAFLLSLRTYCEGFYILKPRILRPLDGLGLHCIFAATRP